MLFMNRNENESLVFVYGTLMQGRRNYSRYLAPLKPVAEGTADGFRMYDVGTYPAIVRGSGRIKGEVYSITPDLLVRMDHLEEEGSLYIRTPVTVETSAGETLPAEVYVYNQSVEDLPEIPFDAQPYRGV